MFSIVFRKKIFKIFKFAKYIIMILSVTCCLKRLSTLEDLLIYLDVYLNGVAIIEIEA